MSTTSAFAHLRRLSTPLSREAALVRSRLYTSKIPVGTLPQVLVSAVAPHRTGASKDLAALIFEQGGSIAATKKIMVEDHFAMMLSVYTPPDGAAPTDIVSTLTSGDTTAKLGFAVERRLFALRCGCSIRAQICTGAHCIKKVLRHAAGELYLHRGSYASP